MCDTAKIDVKRAAEMNQVWEAGDVVETQFGLARDTLMDEHSSFRTATAALPEYVRGPAG